MVQTGSGSAAWSFKATAREKRITMEEQRRNSDGSLKGTPFGIRVFGEEGEYVVANGGGWLEGVYPTVEAAVSAAR